MVEGLEKDDILSGCLFVRLRCSIIVQQHWACSARRLGTYSPTITDVKRVETNRVGRIQLLAPGNLLGQYLHYIRTCCGAQ